MKLKVYSFHEPVFLADVILLYGGELKELSEWYKNKHITSDCDPKLQGYVELLDHTLKDGTIERSYIIRIEEDDFYTLSHECLHLTRHILTDRGIPFDGKNDETIAYYQGYWLKKLWRITGKK